MDRANKIRLGRTGGREWEWGTGKAYTTWVNVNNAKNAARGHISTLSM